METQNKIISYKELLQRNKDNSYLFNKEFVMIPKRKLRGLGYTLIGLGIITFWIPFTTIPFIVGGCLCLGISYYKLKEETKRKLRVKLNKWGLR